MDTLLKTISQYPNGTPLIIEWPKYTIWGKIDTIYDSDNGEELSSAKYQSFYVCVFQVTDVLYHSAEKQEFAKGDLIEISMLNPPKKVFTEDGKLVWENE
jgi:hypothetical protein